MFRQILLFTLLLAFARGSYKFIEAGEQLDKTVYPPNITTLTSLDEFVKLVDEHKLNVSLIISNGKNWEEDNLKEAVAMTITFPANSESITKPTLDEKSYKKLAEAAHSEGLTVAGSHAVNNKLKVYTNNRKGIPINRAYKIFTGIKNDKTGFVFDEENYVAQYTFLVPGSDGKNQTTRVLHGDIDVEVVDKSPNVKDTELATIKKALIDSWFSFDESLAPRAIVEILDKALPDHDWQVGADVGEHSYIDSNYWVLLEILDEKFLIYSV